ncbi:hypothetical protein ACMGDH_05435 [Sphingomonas sp. DT-207]|uniref:hypothetical protein n=1 Tax=Sphingomonas sp. DT-207 TaxID=3396167 RepID=UPI003F1C4F72
MKKLQILAVGVCLAATACGGGGSSSGGGTIAVSPQAPIPTPTPTPTPSPAPRFEAGLVGYITIDSNDNGQFAGVIADAGDTRTTTDRWGRFGPDVLDRLDSSQTPAAPLWAMSATGYDDLTGFHYADVRTPRGGTVLSPVTTLLRNIDDDVVPANLGLAMDAARLAGFNADHETSTSDPTGDPNPAIRPVAREVVLVNLKLLALAGFPNSTGFGPDRSIVVAQNLAPLSEQLRIGRVDLNDAASIRSVLDRSPVARRASEEARNAAAQLLARWGQAIDRFGARRDATRFPFGYTSMAIERALRIRILPELMALFGTIQTPLNRVPSHTRLNALTVDELVAGLESFFGMQQARYDIGGVTAVADYVSFDRHVTGNMLALDNQCLSILRQAPHCNDVDVAQWMLPNPINPQWSEARVPAEFVRRIRLSRDLAGNLVIERLDQEPGIIWFEYDVRVGNGPISTSRVYIRLNDDI